MNLQWHCGMKYRVWVWGHCEESTEQDVENYLEQAGLVYNMTLVCTFPGCSCCSIAVDSDRPCVVLVHESVQNRVDVEQEKMRTCILLDLPVP